MSDDISISYPLFAPSEPEPPAAPPFPSGALIQLLDGGLTVGPEPDPDEVYAWDDTGTAGLRFEPATIPGRPLLGGVAPRRGAQNDGSRFLVSTAPLTLVKPYTLWVCLRVDLHVINRRLVDFDANNYLAYGASPGLFRFESGATDLNTVTPVADGSVVQLLIQIAATGGVSRILLNTVEEATLAGTVTAPASRTIGLLARNDGTNPAQATILGAAVWQYADNAAQAAADRSPAAPIHIFGSWLGA